MRPWFAAALAAMTWGISQADGTLSDNQRIASEVLGYDLQYRVYTPAKVEADDGLPVLYVTDGQSYIERGDMHRVVDELIDGAKIDPVIVVFVDARDPDNLRINRRAQQFFCNRNYLDFYVEELVPAIEHEYPVAQDRDSRSILGLSFGGLNAACFGAHGGETFSGIGMQSPANHPVPELLPLYEELPLLPLRVFLSTGTPNDNTEANPQLPNRIAQ